MTNSQIATKDSNPDADTSDQYITSDMKPIHFTVDSALLQELGEKLVGRPHIALAELIKNSYDADATVCKITIEPNRIIISDNGNGMSEDIFRSRWMRVGTTKKQDEKVSERGGRPLTGSKGVGRLSAQFLAERITVSSQSYHEVSQGIYAYVNWNEAVTAGELTQACAHFKTTRESTRFPKKSIHGTTITLVNLKQQWSKDEFKKLAQELWMLQSPEGFLGGEVSDKPDQFIIELDSTYKDLQEEFTQQMSAALQNWQAAISGEIISGRRTKEARITVRLKNGRTFTEKIELTKCYLNNVKFQVRIFKLSGKQAHGIAVNEARDYFKKYGGVHVYDSGFRLPYYGIEQDWLDVEVDHSHRLTVSKLLPPRLMVDMAMNDLPTQQRIFGVVAINTGMESTVAADDEEHLKIQVTRDRLIDNEAYQQLKYVVRWSLDYYASCYRLSLQDLIQERPKEAPPELLLERYGSTLRQVKNYVPEPIYNELTQELDEYKTSLKAENEADQQEKALLAPLATAGMAALAFEHESGKEISEIKRISEELRYLSHQHLEIPELKKIAEKIVAWTRRVEGSRRLFFSLSNQDDREQKLRLKIRPVLSSIWENLEVFMRGIKFDTSEIPREARFPNATVADWQALFQNIFTNAANAMLDQDTKIIKCVYHETRNRGILDILDTGVGVNIETAGDLFSPFIRKLEISPERKALGLGGVGLGLTIVNMIAESRNAKVEFVTPPNPFRTAFRISWSRPRDDNQRTYM